ncbi:unnamed protein product, partial [marine sediment metagenome]
MNEVSPQSPKIIGIEQKVILQVQALFSIHQPDSSSKIISLHYYVHLHQIEKLLRDTEKELQTIEKDLEFAQKEIKQGEDELIFEKRMLKEKTKLLENRLREIYKRHLTGYLEILFNSESFSDFLSRFRYIKNILSLDAEVINLVGLEHKKKIKPHLLSGGEQQKLCIARAIANEPLILLTDEPTGNLDPYNSWEIMKLLFHINIRGTTIIMASHDKLMI